MKLSRLLFSLLFFFLCSNALAQRLESNLISNSGAESNPGAFSFGDQKVPTGWSRTGTFTALEYASGGFGDLNEVDSENLDGGENFFAGGPSAADSSGSQAIDISSFSSLIDSGALGFILSADIGGHSTDSDNATVKVEFFDDGDVLLQSATIGPVEPTDRDNLSQLISQETASNVPPSATSALVTIQANHNEGAYNDGYVDNVSLALFEAMCPNDSNKERPGVCGCGVSDSDSNDNGIADCLDPMPGTTPAAAALVQGPARNRAVATLQTYKDPEVVYTVTSTCGKKTKTETVTGTNVYVFRNTTLKKRECAVSYTAGIAGYEQSNPSPESTIILGKTKNAKKLEGQSILKSLSSNKCKKIRRRPLSSAKDKRTLRKKKRYCRANVR